MEWLIAHSMILCWKALILESVRIGLKLFLCSAMSVPCPFYKYHLFKFVVWHRVCSRWKGLAHQNIAGQFKNRPQSYPWPCHKALKILFFNFIIYTIVWLLYGKQLLHTLIQPLFHHLSRSALLQRTITMLNILGNF